MPDSQKVVYLAGPFTGHVESNRTQARLAASYLRKEDYAVIVPHLESLGCESSLTEIEWVRHGVSLLRKCDFIAIFGDWQNSRGTKIELNNATHWDIPLLAIFDKYGNPLWKYSGGLRSAESWKV